MMKAIVCVALLCAAVVLANGGPAGGRGGGGGGGHGGNGGGGHGGGDHDGHGNKDQWETDLCNNNSLAQQFLVQTQQLITALQGNGSFGDVLSNRATQIAYLQDTNNGDLLSSNCTAYFIGYNSAKQTDQQNGETQRQYQKAASQAFFQIIQSLVGGNGYPNDD